MLARPDDTARRTTLARPHDTTRRYGNSVTMNCQVDRDRGGLPHEVARAGLHESRWLAGAHRGALGGTSALRILVAVALLSVTASCGEPTTPVSLEECRECVIVGMGESAPLALVDVTQGRVVARLLEGWRPASPFAASIDGRTLYFDAYSTSSGTQLHSVDARTFRLNWSLPISDSQVSYVDNGVELWSGAGLTASPDGTALFLAQSYRDGMPGIAVLDIRTRQVTGFIGPLVVTAGLATFGASAEIPNGAVLAIGARTNEPRPGQDSLFVIDPSTLGVVLADIVFERTQPGRLLTQAIPASDGRHVLVVSEDSIHKLDVLSGETVAAAMKQGLGQLTASPNEGPLYFTDAGTWPYDPGSGQVAVFGPGLEPRPPIALNALSEHGHPYSMRAMAVSADAGRLFVTVGTPSRGPIYGPQASNVIVLDASSGETIAIIPLDDWGVGPIAVVP